MAVEDKLATLYNLLEAMDRAGPDVKEKVSDVFPLLNPSADRLLIIAPFTNRMN